MNSQCPKEMDLRAFVDEHVGPESLKLAIEQHLEDCNACQTKIERWLQVADQDIRSGDIQDPSVEALIQELESNQPELEVQQSILTGKVLGDYQIGELIGRGNAGVVYRALDPKFNREVAVKVLRNDFAASDRARIRLEREARATASLKQQNIVAVHDVCIDPIGISYLVMEIVEGGTLRQQIRDGQTIETKRAAKIAQQILQGLNAAHEKGLVHRDLKSSNVLIQRKTGVVKLTDFGLVRDLESDSQLTQENMIAGTPAYMSPEQVLTPQEVDHRADIYSLGVVLYEMLVGELPFRGIERMVLKQVVHDQPRSLRRQNDSISRDLETICIKAMAKSPDARYESAQLMHDDLGRFLRGETILARRVGPLSKAWNWSRRNASLASLIALSVGLLLALAIGSTVAAVKIRTASLKEQRQAQAAARQRDQTLDTLRTLVFDVNELLEPGDTDLDEIQEKLLTVALKGIEEVDRTGEDAGIVDDSMVAAKNRLGDVYFRLDRLDEARNEYENAIAVSKRINSKPSELQHHWEERLRAYEGLASIAMLNDDSERELELVEKADSAAARLSQLTGGTIEPAYFVEPGYYFTQDEVEEMHREFRDAIAKPPRSVSAVESVPYLADSIGAHYLEMNQIAKAEKIYSELIKWLGDGFVEGTKSRLRRSLGTARYIGFTGLSSVALEEQDDSKYVEMLRKAVDSIPRVGTDKSRFHRSAEDYAEYAVEELITELEDIEPEQWMPEYFRMAFLVAKETASYSPAVGRLQLESLSQQMRYIRMLSRYDQQEEAMAQWKSVVNELDSLDWESLPRKPKQKLQSRLNELKQLDLKWQPDQ